MSLEFYPTAQAQGSAVVVAQTAPQSSIELVQGAKGDTRVTVKVYASDPYEAAVRAMSLYDRLCQQYARGEAQP